MEENKPKTMNDTLFRTMRIDLRTWTALKNLKAENETYNDVVLKLLNQRTVSLGNDNVNATKYFRKTSFLTLEYQKRVTIKSVGYAIRDSSETNLPSQEFGVEIEYNDIVGQQADFTLDLKLKKIYFHKRVINPSIFLGIDSAHKHFSSKYLKIYLRCMAHVLEKEFKVDGNLFRYSDITEILLWRKLYYNYSLSEESFISDIQEPLEQSVTEKPTEEQKKNIDNAELTKDITIL